MKCAQPLTIKNPQTGKYIEVPCGKCSLCQSNLVADWAFRLRYEAEQAKSVYFIRLSYDDEHLPMCNGVPTLDKTDLQKFFKRIRKAGLQIRYFAVGEYGGKFGRPHYHLLLFLPKKYEWHEFRKLIYDKWYKQHINIQTARSLVRLAHYCGKYCFKDDNRIDQVNQVKPFRLVSKKPMLGYGYIQKYGDFHRYHEEFRFLSVESRPDSPKRLPLAFQRKIFKTESIHAKLLRNSKPKKDYEISKYLKMGTISLSTNHERVKASLRRQREELERIRNTREQIRKSQTDRDL